MYMYIYIILWTMFQSWCNCPLNILMVQVLLEMEALSETFFDISSRVFVYQALTDVRSTGAGIECLYFLFTLFKNASDLLFGIIY